MYTALLSIQRERKEIFHSFPTNLRRRKEPSLKETTDKIKPPQTDYIV